MTQRGLACHSRELCGDWNPGMSREGSPQLRSREHLYYATTWDSIPGDSCSTESIAYPPGVAGVGRAGTMWLRHLVLCSEYRAHRPRGLCVGKVGLG